MTDVEHAPTEQEQAIYDALTTGDQDAIAQLHDTAYGIEAPPVETDAPVEGGGAMPSLPDGGAAAEPEPLDAAQQYEVDYANAMAHYQSDHEAPEDERVQNTAKQVQADNQRAAAIEEGLR